MPPSVITVYTEYTVIAICLSRLFWPGGRAARPLANWLRWPEKAGYDNRVSEPIITATPDVLGGVPVFAGTRVPVQTCLDYLKAGQSINDFLEGFPSVSREQVLAFLEEAQQRIPEMIRK